MDNRRRGKMVKLFESYGNRVQKSAFEALLTLRQYNDLIPQIVHIMDEEDNVRLYRLNSSNEIVLLGKSDTIYEEEVIII
ncbi:MAG: CRISPR-associated endonuclease Cas2 [Firmicutes bacterium]|nr:CRISPR-associated endonuclease Cas2 [Bacillota bacterium]